MAIECARCKAPNADGQKFCGACGGPLDPAMSALKDLVNSTLRDQVHEIIERHYKDQKVVEIEITQAVANRLLDWAKLLRFFVGTPVALLLLILGVLAIKSYNDLWTLIDKGKAEVTAAELAAANLKSRTASIDSDYQKLSTKISDTRTALETQVKTLSAKVDDIGEKVGFTPTSKISKETKLRLDGALAKFQDYVKGLGYRSDAGKLGVDVKEKMPRGPPAIYSPRKRQLIIGRDYVDDRVILYRAYMLQILTWSGPDLHLVDYSAIYSGLATYFSYSFVGDPRPDLGSWDLTKKRPFIEFKPTGDSVLRDGTEIWGSAFWELRTILTQDVADKILFEAWVSLHGAKVRADRGASFVRKLFDLDKTHEAQIRAVFEQRGLSL